MAERPFDEQPQDPGDPLDEQPLDEEALKEFLRGVLNDTNPVITKLADLPSVWRDTPEGEPDPDHPGFANRAVLLYSYMDASDTHAWAWEGVRDLLRWLLANGEGIPPPLAAVGHRTSHPVRPLRRSAAGRRSRTGTFGFRWYTRCCGVRGPLGKTRTSTSGS